jgi:hypothetical protein
MAADFGLDVTIAIAAITVPDGYIVTVSDRMISWGDYTPAEDSAALKNRKVGKKWGLMFAADDANMFLPIVLATSDRLGNEEHDLEAVQSVISDVYKQKFDSEVTSRYLVRYGFRNVAEFRAVGLAQFGNEKFLEICEAIDKFDLGITLLGYGYDKKKTPHIFEVANPGIVTSHDLLGYAVIGSGYFMASASLRRKPLKPDLEAVIYRLLEAKFSAETASGVGKASSVITIGPDAKHGSSNARSGANCSSGPEVNEKKLCKRAFCPPRKSAKLMLVISPEELPNATTAPFASTACNAVANDAPPADLPQFDRRLAVGRIDQCEHLRLSRPSRNNDHAPHRPKRDPIRRGCSTCRTNPANSRHRAPRAQRLITPAPPISCCRARKCSGSRYHSKEAYLWPSSPGCVHSCPQT